MALKHSQLLIHWKRLQTGKPMKDWGGRGHALEYLRGCDLELKDSEEVRWPFGVTSEQHSGKTHHGAEFECKSNYHRPTNQWLTTSVWSDDSKK